MRALFALLLIVGLLVGCTTPGPAPTAAPSPAATAGATRAPTEAPTAVATAVPTPAATTTPIVLPTPQFGECTPLVEPRTPGAAGPKEIATPKPGDNHQGGAPFVDGTLILSGKKSAIQAVVAAVNEKLGEQVLLRTDEKPLNESEFYGFETSLFTFARGQRDAYEIARQARDAAKELRVVVFADPNFVLSATDTGGCAVAGTEGSPLSGEGSPLSGEGSPLSGEGSPVGTGITAPAELFWGQWGFNTTQGIGLVDNSTRASLAADGKDTAIIVFDTSPFLSPGEAQFNGAGWPDANFRICVEHPMQVDLTDEGACKGLPDQSDHGVFVAGLAHAVAPASELRLIRVLDKHGKGELQNFLYALGHINRAQLSKAVLNLSLGFALTPTPGNSLDRLRDANICEFTTAEQCVRIVDTIMDQGTPREVIEALMDQDGLTLFLAISDIASAGPVIAAAAGNHSGATVLPPQLPAGFWRSEPAMLAVAADTSERKRAFYSHSGRLAAPGGGSDAHLCLPTDSPACVSSLEYWMISAAQHEDSALGKYWSYGAWMGTSFATPLVSGAAALKLSAGDTAVKAVDGVLADVCPTPVTTASDPRGAGVLCLK